MQAPFLADVVKHHDGADEIAGAVADRRRRILDGEFLAAAIDQNRVLGEAQHLAFAKTARRPGFRRLRA